VTRMVGLIDEMLSAQSRPFWLVERCSRRLHHPGQPFGRQCQGRRCRHSPVIRAVDSQGSARNSTRARSTAT